MTRFQRCAAAAAAFALAACGSGGDDHEAAESPVALNEWSGGAGNRALLTGPLSLEGDCVTVNGEMVAFPRGYTEWNGDTQTLTFGGHDFAMGDEISAGGGYVRTTETLTIPEGCEDAAATAMFSIHADDIRPRD